ncbi:MAG TPA: glucokinase [Dongiaceae bacterium]|jgi:glucokinase|nr:glucokinase [Dongiaceae bacterium]
MSGGGVGLVADIGGTNARFGLAASGERVSEVHILSAADFPTIEEAISHYMQKTGATPDRACFAVACPPDEETIQFTNSPWRFQPRLLASRFGFTPLIMANDFEALALGVAHLPPEGLVELKPGRAVQDAARAVIGPGTGLGVSGLVRSDSGWAVLQGEGGHAGFAPQDETEIALLRYAQRQFGRVSNERILQGAGIVLLYRFFCEQAGRSPAEMSAADIAQSDDPQAREAMHRFVAILGSVAGDLALTLRSRGGVFIGGGIVPKSLPLFRDPIFVKRFCDKGRLARMLVDMPIMVILDHCAALYGAAHLLERRKNHDKSAA